MASIVLNSQFKPFSYAELIAPVQASTEAHQQLETEASALEAQAETIRARAEQEALNNPNAQWVQKYNNYVNNLNAAANKLTTQGLQPGVRQQLIQARKDYMNSVDPAIKAIEQQNKMADAQYTANPALRMVYGDMPTIDALIGDMTLKPIAYSGADVYTQAATSAKAASARNAINVFMNDPQFEGYIRKVKATGYNAKTLEDMLNIPELNSIVGMVAAQYDGFNGLSEANKTKMQGEILKGLFDGVTYEKDQTMTFNQLYGLNSGGRSSSGNNNTAGSSFIKPVDKYSSLPMTKNRDVRKLNKYKDEYFTVDNNGNYILNERGKRALLSPTQIHSSNYPIVVDTTKDSEDRTFNSYIKGLAGGNVSNDNISSVGELFKSEYNSVVNNEYDAIRSTEWEITLDTAQQEQVAQVIQGFAQKDKKGKNNIIHKVRLDKSTDTWTKYDDGTNWNEALADGGKVSSLQVSPSGVTFKISNDKKSERYFFPVSGPIYDNIVRDMDMSKNLYEKYNIAKNNKNGVYTLTNDEKQSLVDMGVYPSVWYVPDTINVETLNATNRILATRGINSLMGLISANTSQDTKWVPTNH